MKEYIDKEKCLSDIIKRLAVKDESCLYYMEQQIYDVVKHSPTADVIPVVFGKWKKLDVDYMTPGGTPFYVCAQCGGSEHLHGVEFPRRKMICDNCCCINSYPWEKIYDDAE